MADSAPQGVPPDRARSFLIALLIGAVCCASLVLLAVQIQSRSDQRVVLHFPDFMVFWAAGPTVQGGGLQELFDTAAFTARQNALFAPILDAPLLVRPWLYPPSFLLIASHFAALPFLTSAILVQVGGALALWFALERRTLRWLLVLLSPAFGATVLPGQLSAWIAAALVGGILLMERHPMLAGILLGLVSIKPHLFVLVPVALVAARAWRTLWGCLATAAGLVVLSLLQYGWAPWLLWLQAATGPAQVIEGAHYTRYAATMGSVLDTLRTLGASRVVAWSGQLAAAAGAIAAVWFTFRRPNARGSQLLILTSGSLLLAPYWLNYDLLLPTLAIAAVATETGIATDVPGEKLGWLIVWMLPYAMPLSRGLYGIPIGAAVIAGLLLITLRRHEVTRELPHGLARTSPAAQL